MTGGSGIPGEVLVGAEPVRLNADRPARALVVVNTGDRPVQIGSHYHLAAANPALQFDRAAAWGHRLDIPAGTAVRFEPGITREVSVVPLAGRRVVPGLRLGGRSELDGPAGAAAVAGAAAEAGESGMDGPAGAAGAATDEPGVDGPTAAGAATDESGVDGSDAG